MINNIWQNFFQNNFDKQTAIFFLAHRSDLGINIFAVISFFGNWQFLLPAMLVVVGLLYFKNNKKFIIPLTLTVITAEFITFLGKHWFHRLRPLFAVFKETDFSFPSGHSTIAIAFYGYLAYILIKLLKNKYQWLIITVTVLMVVLIGLSRLYLGVHYVSDVFAGYLVGSLSLTIGLILTERYLVDDKK